MADSNEPDSVSCLIVVYEYFEAFELQRNFEGLFADIELWKS